MIVKLQWNPTSQSLQEMFNQMMKRSQHHNVLLQRLDPTHLPEAEKFLSLIADDIYECSGFHSYCNFLKYVSPVREVRRQARRIDQQLTEYLQSMNQQKGPYEALLRIHTQVVRSEEDQVFLNRVIVGYERSGVRLNPKEKEQLRNLKQQEKKLQDQLNQEVSQFEKLIGLSVDDINDLPTHLIQHFPLVSEPGEPKRYGMPLNRATYHLALKYLRNAESRRKLEFIYNTWCLNTAPLFLQLVHTRHHLARLTGYSSYGLMSLARHNLETPEQVRKFLSEILEVSQRSFQREIKYLQKLKGSPTLYTWDLPHLTAQWKKQYGFDQEVVREYFPLEQVLLGIGQKLDDYFGVRIQETCDEVLWHPLVKKYQFLYQNELVGTLYLDLFGRKGKFSGVGCFGIRSHGLYPFRQGKRLQPVMGLVMNLTATQGTYLMTHHEVATLMHELGHVLHYFFRRSKYSLMNGSDVEPDFIQVPSQIMHRLAWNKTFLKEISKHYQTQMSLPPEILEKIHKSRNLEIGISIKKRVFISVLDQLVHSSHEFIKIVTEMLQDKSEQRDENLRHFLNTTSQQLFDQVIARDWIQPNQGIIFPHLWLNLVEKNEGMYSHLWSEMTSTVLYEQCFGDEAQHTPEQLFQKLFSAPAWVGARSIIQDLLGRKISISEYLQYHELTQETEELSRFMSDFRPLPEPDSSDLETEDFTLDEDFNYFSEREERGSVSREQVREMLQKNRLPVSNQPDTYILEDTETLQRYDQLFYPQERN